MFFFYLITWLGSLGQSKNKVVRIFVFMHRAIHRLFFVKMQVLTIVEVGCHSMRAAQPALFHISFYFSALLLQIVVLELLRSWALIKRGFTIK